MEKKNYSVYASLNKEGDAETAEVYVLFTIVGEDVLNAIEKADKFLFSAFPGWTSEIYEVAFCEDEELEEEVE